MNQIQDIKLVELEINHLSHIQTHSMQYVCDKISPTYSKLSLYTKELHERRLLNAMSFIDFSTTKSKGLTVSLRRSGLSPKQFDNQNSTSNPQIYEDMKLQKRKTASTLIKTSHTIHHLGRSLSKSKEEKQKCSQFSKQQFNSSNKLTGSFNLLKQSLKDKQQVTSKQYEHKKNDFSRNLQITIDSPKPINIFFQSQGLSQTSLRTKQGKINELKCKQFLRSSRKEDQTDKKMTGKNIKQQNSIELKTSQQINQIKSKRQFLQSYIQKPMVNSIIMSATDNNLAEEPQSPVMRLKKRLQLNSINCIYEKETLVSNEVQQSQARTIQIQQSIIVHRNVLENIRPLMSKMHFFSQFDDYPYKLYLGKESLTNLILTVKQLQLECFQKFAREIRIYQQISACRLDMTNIMELIKHSTDSDKHVIIKQPFTETLVDYLQNLVMQKITQIQFNYVQQSIIHMVSKTIETFGQRGIILRRKISMNDFLYVFMNLKFQNMEMFEIGLQQKVEMKEVLQSLGAEMQGYFNRISCRPPNVEK